MNWAVFLISMGVGIALVSITTLFACNKELTYYGATRYRNLAFGGVIIAGVGAALC